MKIIVDADACPVKKIIEEIAENYSLEVTMVIDTSHTLYSEYSKIITVDKGKDTVDIVVINNTDKGDIVVTQDFGVATMALGKGAFPLNHNGVLFTNDNMDEFLFERHLSQKARKIGKKTFHQKKRTENENMNFKKSLNKLCQTLRS